MHGCLPCPDGIGKAYTHELAKSGLNIVLMARNQEKLDECAKELQEAYGVQTMCILFDFGTLSTEDSVKGLKALLDEKLADIDVSMLVNNVGTAYYGSLHESKIWDSMKQINVCINSQTYMS